MSESLKKIAKEVGSLGEIARLDLTSGQKKIVRRLYRVLHRND